MLQRINASQLVSLLKTLVVLSWDYHNNPDGKLPNKWDSYLSPTVGYPGLNEAIKAAKSGRNKYELLFNLGSSLIRSMEKFKAYPQFTANELQQLKNVASYLKSGTPEKFKLVDKCVSELKDPVLDSLFAPDVKQFNHSKLHKTVNALVGRKGTFLTPDEKNIVGDTDPEGLEEYKEERKKHYAAAGELLKSLVRKSGKPLIPYQDAYNALNAAGFDHILVPGHTGLIDAVGKIYTPKGELIPTRPSPDVFARIETNPNVGEGKGNNWAIKAFRHETDVTPGRMSQFYTENYTKSASESKYQKVRDLLPELNSIRTKWQQYILKFDISNPACVCAVVLELLYNFSARMGTAKGKGMGTLAVKNVTVTPNGATIKYLGKCNIPQKNAILPNTPVAKKIISILAELEEGKLSSDYLFTYTKEGKKLRVFPANINKFFKSLGSPVSCHKLRTAKGSSIWIEEEGKYKPKTEKEAIAAMNAIAVKVGAALSHIRGVEAASKVTGATALSSYIDPTAVISTFIKWGFRPPKAIEKVKSLDTSDSDDKI